MSDELAKKVTIAVKTVLSRGGDYLALFEAIRDTLPPEGKSFRSAHDGFEGVVIGGYTRLDGYEGFVLQQNGTKVVHVYGKKHLELLK